MRIVYQLLFYWEIKLNLKNHYYFSILFFPVLILGIELVYGLNSNSSLDENGLFLNPISSVVDSKGSVYVVDNDNHNVQKFSNDGNFILKWTSKNPGNTMFEHPYGIAIDSQDNVYVVDQNHGKIKKLSESGYISSSFGSFGFEEGEFDSPTNIAIDSEDNIYIVDYGFEKIQKFSNDGLYLHSWGSEGSQDGQFSRPLGIAINSEDDVYVLDEGSIEGEKYSRVQKFSSDGIFILKWGSYGTGDGQFLSPSSIAIDSSDVIHITDYKSEFLQKFSKTGEFVEKISLFKEGSENYSGTTSVSIANNTGNFFVTTNLDKQIMKFSSDGNLLSKWGGEASWHSVRDNSGNDDEKIVPRESAGDYDRLYDTNGNLVTLIEKNQETVVTFYLDPLFSSKNYDTAVTKYHFSSSENEESILKSEESDPIVLNSQYISKPVLFPFSWPDNGSFVLKQFVEYTDNLGNTSVPYGNTEHIFIVEKTGNAVNDKGLCKNPEFVIFINHDFSKVACVSYETSLALYQRGW